MSLTIFSIEDFEPRLSDEALLIEEFKVLHSLAYNKGPGDAQGRERKRALLECRYIYHMYHYRSEFSEYSEEERHVEALLGAGLEEDYKISPELEACIKIFNKLQVTRMLKVLDIADNTLDRTGIYLKSIDYSLKDKEGYPIYTAKEVKDIMSLITDLGPTNTKITALRKQVKAELRETDTLRGEHEGGFDGAR